MRVHVGALMAVSMGFAACSSNPPARDGRSCALSASDSAYVGSQPLFKDCQVDQVAKAIDTRLELPSSPMASPDPRCYRAEVQFVVGADGIPERDTIRLMSGGGDFLANAVLASVPNWKYRPAVLHGNPVRQLIRERRMLETRVRVSTPQGSVSREAPRGCR